MQQYVARRILQVVPLLIGITLVTFFIMQLAPGNPMRLMIDPTIDPEEIAAAEEKLGLNDPIIVQYFRWVTELAQGNMGYAVRNGRPVAEIIFERLPATLLLTSTAFAIGFGLAIPLGVFSALRRYSTADYFLTVFSFLGLSIPSFFFGLGLIYIFALKLRLLPTSGVETIGAGLQGLALWKDRALHVIMPAMALGLQQVAVVMRYTRSGMLETLGKDYIRTARAKGLSERVVVYRHALRNAVIPVITIFGMSLPFLFGGAFIVEQVFAWPGMGRLGIEAIFAREYPIIMGINLFTSSLVLLGNLLADLMYAWVDPRIRYS